VKYFSTGTETGLMRPGKSHLKYPAFLWIFCLGLILGGCTAAKTSDQTPADPMEKWHQLAKTTYDAAATPPDTSGSLDSSAAKDPIPPGPAGLQPVVVHDLSSPDDPSGPVPAQIRKLPDLPVTMNMNDVSVPVLLRTLAKIADLNMMINDGITGQTQLVVKGSPWNQVFLGLLDAYGLAYEWTGDILQVFSAADFKKRQSLLEARNDYENAKIRQELARSQLAYQKRRQEPLITKIVTIRYANLESLHQNLNQYLAVARNEKTASLDISSAMLPIGNAASEADVQIRPGEKGSIMMDATSNALIIHASQSDIDQLMPIIQQLDQPSKQVLIEAHIVEVESNTGKALGIQWGGLGNFKTSSDKQISVGGDISPFGQQLQDGTFLNPADGNVVNLPMVAETGMNLGVMAQKMGSFVLYAQLMALQEQGVLNILSKPSITTQNHQKAIIRSGKEVPYQTVEGTGSDQTVNIEWKEAVIKLEVTPHIIDGQAVRLDILTNKDELDFTASVNGNPTIITKNAETSVTLQDGQTTVIAGLNKEKKTDSEQGVPGLKEMPGLGWLFKSTNNENEKEELLIFITPHILDNQIIAPAKKG
jgi:type IV pilus assembly protein PilQ